jgi:signal transduction histidine kinase
VFARMSLTTRTFLFSFLPVCVVLAASFLALNTLVQQHVKSGLRESLQKSQELLARANEDYSRRISQFVSVLASSAGLEAAMGLMREAPMTPEAAAEVRRTIEAQLREMHGLVGYDLLAVTDWKGRTLAAVEFGSSAPASTAQPTGVSSEATFLHSGAAQSGAAPGGIVQSGGVVYEVTSAPIAIAGEQIGELKLGARFDLSRYHLGGETALIENGRILEATIPRAAWGALENELLSGCRQPLGECEVRRDGETYLVLPVRDERLGPGFQLIALQSLDAAVRSFTAGWAGILIKVGVSGVLLALLFTLATSRSVTKPLRDLTAQLERGARASHFPEGITVGNRRGQAARELEVLAESFNRVATAERRTREELERAKVAAESANRVKGEFLTTISHELRTPMNGVMGMTELLLDTPLDEEQTQFASTVRDSANLLLGIINDILDFSRLDAGTMTLHVARFNLRETLRETIEPLEAQASAKGLEFVLHDSPDAPTALMGDAARIQQIASNLIGNAIKFTHRGRVDVELRCAEQTSGPGEASVVLAVRDTGIGIPADKLDLVFEKFTQADGSMTRRYGGTGMGLALVKQLVEVMGGRLDVESREGVGSTFTVALRLGLVTAPALAGREEQLVSKEAGRC